MRIQTRFWASASVLALATLPGFTTAAVERQWVHFSSNGISIAAHLYMPSSNTSSNFTGARRPAIVVGHPRGGVKEQTAGLYARELAEQGSFITLAFDAAYQGESGRLPRYLEDLYQRANDVRNAVTYLTTLDIVDPDNIGALGVCASGGYVPFAAHTDKRIQAVATVSAVDLGVLNAEGINSFNGPLLPNLNGLLAAAGRQRTAEAHGAQHNLTRHPTSPNLNVWRSIDMLETYRSFTFMQLISPRPLLMIVGGDADTRYFSDRAMEIAEEPKELFVIPGLTHIDIYDHTSESTPKLVEFFTKSLRVSAEGARSKRSSCGCLIKPAMNHSANTESAREDLSGISVKGQFMGISEFHYHHVFSPVWQASGTFVPNSEYI